MPGKVTGFCSEKLEGGDGSPWDYLGRNGASVLQFLASNTPNSLAREPFTKFRQRYPNLKFALRTVVGTTEGAQLTYLGYPSPAKAAANKMIDLAYSCLEKVPEIDIFQPTNEMCDLMKDPDRKDLVKWYAEFNAEYARLCTERLNKKAMLINHPRGCPSGLASFGRGVNPELWDALYREELALYLPALQAINQYEHWWTVHEYSATQNLFDSEEWYILRHRLAYEQACILDSNLKSIKMCNGEGYIDVIGPDGKSQGFRKFKDTKAYGQDMINLETRLREPASRQMEFTICFGAFMYDNWQSRGFDVIGNGEQEIFSALKTISNLPAPEPPLEPEENMYQAGIRWNPNSDMPVTVIPKSTLSINITNKASCDYITKAKEAGYFTYILFGTEAAGAGYPFTEAGLRSFLNTYSSYVDMLTVNNEWNDWGNPLHTNYIAVKEINAWGAKVCKEFNIPFAICSTLTHSFSGINVGFEDLAKVYPTAADLPEGAYIDIHLYTATTDPNTGAPTNPEDIMYLLNWWTKGFDDGAGNITPSPFANCKFIVGEFGTTINDHIAIYSMFEYLLSEPKVKAALYFCLQDFGDSNKTYGILSQSGTPKAGNFDNYVYTCQKYNTGGGNTVARPTYSPSQIVPTKPVVAIMLPSGQTYNKYIGGNFANTENSATEWMTIHTDGNGGILSRCKGKSFEAVAILPALENVVADASTAIPKSIALARAYALKYPNTKFLLISFHTDAGLNQHYSTFYNSTYPESKKISDAIGKSFAKIHNNALPFQNDDWKGQGYLAMPDNLPSNLIPVLIEAASHEGATNVKWIEANVDNIAQAFVNGIEAYVSSGPGPTPPPVTPCEEELAATKAELILTKAQLAATQAQLSAANTKIVNAQKALA